MEDLHTSGANIQVCSNNLTSVFSVKLRGAKTAVTGDAQKQVSVSIYMVGSIHFIGRDCFRALNKYGLSFKKFQTMALFN